MTFFLLNFIYLAFSHNEIILIRIGSIVSCD